MEQLTLVSNEGKEFVEDKEFITRYSETIKTMLVGVEGNENIPINFSTLALEKVLAYCKALDIANEKAEKEGKPKGKQNLTEEFKKEFYNMTLHDEVIQVLELADYMHVNPLFDELTDYVANQLRGKASQEIRELMHLTNDFTEEEEKNIREENAWCEN